MSRVCQLTGTRANNGMSVSHSHIRTKKLQQANLQQRRLWWEEENKWINIKVILEMFMVLFISEIGLATTSR